MLRHMEGREVIRENQRDFTKDKSCLTYLMAFYDGVISKLAESALNPIVDDTDENIKEYRPQHQPPADTTWPSNIWSGRRGLGK